MKRYHWALIIIWILVPMSFCVSQGIEEIVIINKYEDNTADLIDTLTFFDLSSPSPLLWDGENYSETPNDIAKPLSIFDRTGQSVVTIPQKNRFSDTMKVTIGTMQSLKNMFNIENTNMSYSSKTECTPGKIQQKDQLNINITNILSIPVTTVFRGNKNSLSIGTGSGIIYQSTEFLVNLLCLTGYESALRSPYIAGSMTAEWFNHRVDGDLSADTSHMGVTSRYVMRGNYFTIIAAESALFSENMKFYQKYSLQTFFLWKENSLALFVLDARYIQKYHKTDLFPLHEKWAGGISYYYTIEYFFIRSALFLTGRYNPLSLDTNGYHTALPYPVTTLSAGITLPRFHLAASLSAKTDYTALSSLQGAVGIYDLHWLQFNMDIEESILADSVFTDFTFDNKVKICYRFATQAMIFTEIQMITELYTPSPIFDTAITVTMGCTVQL